MLQLDEMATFAALAAALVVGSAQAADSSESGPAFNAAIDQLRSMHSMCDSVGGTMVYDDGHLVEMNFSDDGQPDYVVDSTKAYCDGAFTLFCAAQGCAVDAFATAGGKVVNHSANLFDPRPAETAVGYGCPDGGRGELVFDRGSFSLTGC